MQHPNFRPTAAFVAATAAVLTILAPAAWFVLLTDGLYVGVLALSALGWGAWPAAWLAGGRAGEDGDESALRPGACSRGRVLKSALLAAGIGFALLSPVVLALGCAGWLNRVTAWSLVLAGTVLGGHRLIACVTHRKNGPASPLLTADGASPLRTADGAASRPAAIVRYAAAFVLAPLAAIMVFGSTLPPGILWPEEAGGYDALEYHLQAPREYYDAGRVHFLPHNVYASFPQQMEMLYLLLMHLTGDLNAAAIASQLLHASFGVLTVLAVAAFSPPGRGAPAAMLAAASAAWLAYLGCLAYVELGILFFGALAAGLLLDCIEPRCDAGHRWTGLRTVFLAGLMAGAAAGCKYTAAAMVAAGLGAAWLGAMRGSIAARIRAFALYAIGAALTFSPWLIRNTAFTGNPVYPFAYELFGGEAWSAEQAEQWKAGHEHRTGGEALSPNGRLPVDGPAHPQSRLGWDAASRTKAALHELLASGMFGIPLFAVAVIGAMARGRRALMLGVWTALMLAIWIAVTHVPGRFAVPIVVPLALLAGCSARFRHNWPANVIVGIGAVGVLLAGWRLHAKLGEVDRRWNGQLHLLPGMADAMAGEWNYINNATPPGSHVWLVGEARAFYVRDRKYHYTVAFNRDPWIVAAEAGATPDELVAWLRREGVTHVVFNWPEIERLRRTYGFSPVVTREWLARLSEQGLTAIRDSALPGGVDVYIVSRPQ